MSLSSLIHLARVRVRVRVWVWVWVWVWVRVRVGVRVRVRARVRFRVRVLVDPPRLARPARHRRLVRAPAHHVVHLQPASP